MSTLCTRVPIIVMIIPSVPDVTQSVVESTLYNKPFMAHPVPIAMLL